MKNLSINICSNDEGCGFWSCYFLLPPPPPKNKKLGLKNLNVASMGYYFNYHGTS